MKVIQTNDHGELRYKDLNYYGGQYSLWEKIKKNGTGSPKVVYESGIEAFDKLKRNVSGEIGFASFELLKNGLILRLNLNQRLSCIGIRLDDIQEIKLIAYKVEINHGEIGKQKTQIVNRGELKIVCSLEDLQFSVIVKEFKGTRKFFSKMEFDDKFHFTTGTNPPEKDFSYLIEMLEMFDYL